MPRLGPLDATRDNDEARSGRDHRLCFFPVIAAAIEKLKIDIRHPHDVGHGAKRIHPIDIAGLVADQIGPAVRIKGDRRRAACIFDHRQCLGRALFIGKRRRSNMD